MNRPTRPKATPPDPLRIADRPRYVELTPDEERAFRQKLAECEAAHRQTDDPYPLWKALDLVELSGQTVPYWLTHDFFRVVMLGMTYNVMKRARELGWAARRYECVRDLRETVDERTGKKYTKPAAIDQALIKLRAEGDKGVKRRGISRDAVEDCYDKVKKDLERRGCESQYYFFVKKNEGDLTATRAVKGAHLLPEQLRLLAPTKIYNCRESSPEFLRWIPPNTVKQRCAPAICWSAPRQSAPISPTSACPRTSMFITCGAPAAGRSAKPLVTAEASLPRSANSSVTLKKLPAAVQPPNPNSAWQRTPRPAPSWEKAAPDSRSKG